MGCKNRYHISPWLVTKRPFKLAYPKRGGTKLATIISYNKMLSAFHPTHNQNKLRAFLKQIFSFGVNFLYLKEVEHHCTQLFNQLSYLIHPQISTNKLNSFYMTLLSYYFTSRSCSKVWQQNNIYIFFQAFPYKKLTPGANVTNIYGHNFLA